MRYHISIIFIGLFLIASSWCCQSKTAQQSSDNVVKKDWWEHAQFYQIYPRSFKDSDGDGIGDLNGIRQQLQYLKDIGVTATWLSPIFKSPMKDFGYDISDFYSIQPEYGTMEDFDKLIEEANKLNIKIILDFVPNHSSDQNEWFIKSVNGDKKFKDYYVWSDGVVDPNNSSNRLPPSNWLSQFRGSAWEWNDKRKQFYLHQFAKAQPDLNYRNPLVVEQMKNVLKFWLNKGIAGFRVDAVPWCFEVKSNPDGTYPNEPLSNLTNDSDNSAYLKHIYTQDQPETVDLVYQWRKLLDDYTRIYGGDSRVLLIESWSPLNYTMQFYGNKTVNGAQIPFNFKFIEDGNLNVNAADLIKIVNDWLNQMPPGRVANWVLGNHDSRRVSTRYGQRRIDIMEMLQMMLPGVSVTYMGEEIGMLDGEISWEQSKDPAALNSNSLIYQQFTRDPERTPFQWNNSTSAGFSSNNTTWLPVEQHYKEINVLKELNDNRSHLKVYKALIDLRKTETLNNGYLRMDAINNDNVLVLERSLEGQPSLILIANIKNDSQTVDLTKIRSTFPSNLIVKIASVASTRNVNNSITSSNILLDGYESLILSY